MDINELRQQINDIDSELTALFNKRMGVSLEVAKYKIKHNMPVLDKERERALLERVSSLSNSEISSYARILYSNIMSLSRSYQHKIINGASPLTDKILKTIESTPRLFPESAKIACQGVEGAYSQHACDRIFKYPVINYFEKWRGVFNAVASGECDYGILPIENSTAGSVNKVYDLLKEYDCYIVKSIRLKIDHSLLAKKNTDISMVKEVFSHEQALNQCSDFLSAMPDVKVTVVKNTAAAAKLVSESDRADVAAIASPDCCSLYPLHELAYSVQNVKNNFTRFICISKNMQIFPGADRSSIMMTTMHTPGALYSVLTKFNAYGINLIKLESRPIPEKNFEFMFYFDIEASVYSPDLMSLFDELYAENCSFTYFGSYSEII